MFYWRGAFRGNSVSEESEKTETRSVRKRKTSISFTRINVLIRGVKDVWETACLRERPLTFNTFSVAAAFLHSIPLSLILSAPGQGSEPARDLCQDLEGILCHTHSQTETVKMGVFNRERRKGQNWRSGAEWMETPGVRHTEVQQEPKRNCGETALSLFK